jgi:hypothetical protein
MGDAKGLWGARTRVRPDRAVYLFVAFSLHYSGCVHLAVKQKESKK